MSRPNKKTASPLVEKKPNSNLKIQGASDTSYYEDVCKNLELDYAAYSKAIADIDRQIEELNGLRALTVAENKKMVAFYHASLQFDIPKVTMEVLTQDSKSFDKIVELVTKSLNVGRLRSDTLSEITSTLENAYLDNKIVKNYQGYRKMTKTELEELEEDEDDFVKPAKKAGKSSHTNDGEM